MTTPKKDHQKATPDSHELMQLIDGVVVRPAYINMDDRGSLTEMYNPAWGVNSDDLVYVYKVDVDPKVAKGWVQHRKQTDRLFFGWGKFKIVLFDDRPVSKTYEIINEIYLGEQKPGLIIIPTYVYHTVQNIGQNVASFINMPTVAYNYKDPDKYRLPLDTDRIPYKFNL